MNNGEAFPWTVRLTIAYLFSQPWIRGLEQEYAVSNLSPLRKQQGTVKQIRKTRFGDKLILKVPSQGLLPARTYVYLIYPPDRAFNRYIERIGHEPSSRLYPRGYLPGNNPRWLVGKAVKIVTYQDFPSGRTMTILWLKEWRGARAGFWIGVHLWQTLDTSISMHSHEV